MRTAGWHMAVLCYGANPHRAVHRFLTRTVTTRFLKPQPLTCVRSLSSGTYYPPSDTSSNTPPLQVSAPVPGGCGLLHLSICLQRLLHSTGSTHCEHTCRILQLHLHVN